jgi:hypothetical protein
MRNIIVEAEVSLSMASSVAKVLIFGLRFSNITVRMSQST